MSTFWIINSAQCFIQNCCEINCFPKLVVKQKKISLGVHIIFNLIQHFELLMNRLMEWQYAQYASHIIRARLVPYPNVCMVNMFCLIKSWLVQCYCSKLYLFWICYVAWILKLLHLSYMRKIIFLRKCSWKMYLWLKFYRFCFVGRCFVPTKLNSIMKTITLST